MKKPAIRILLLVVLLGLAIFYFRYMREGFQEEEEENKTDDTTSTPVPARTPKDITNAMGATSGTFTHGSSCVKKGLAGKTETTEQILARDDKGRTLYCCSGTWSSIEC